MKRIGIALAIALLGAGLAQGQYGYQYMSGGYWFGAQFIGQEGWMVGAKGQVAHTRDGGKNWEFQRNFVIYPPGAPPLLLVDVTFTTPLIGWACDVNPYPDPNPILAWRTTDGGLSWRATGPILTYRGSPSRVTFADTVSGWLAGGIIYKWFGWGWYGQDTSHNWLGICAVSSTKCWAVGDSGWTARTTDGGTTWNKQQAGINSALLDVFFPDTLNGWACGKSGAIIHTTDGGVTWMIQNSRTTNELCRIRFLSPLRGIAIGDSGTILTTVDGGANWIPQSYSINDLTGISFGDSLHGWVIGEGGTTLETSDGGQTWRVTRQGTTERIQGVSFQDDQTGWMSTWEGNIWGTQDGGKVWTKQTSVSPKRLQGLTMANSSTGWAVGDSGLILATRNGGSTWEPQASGTQRNLWNVFTSDAQHAWACAPGRTVFQTSNGGNQWDSIAPVSWPDSGVSGLASVDTLWGWVLFNDGNVWATTNSGRTWSFRGNTGSIGWKHLSFVDPSWGWAVGDRGIVHSSDGGRTWQSQSAYGLKDVVGVTRMRAWAVGDSGRLLATTNGGESWVLQNSNITYNLLSISFADTLNGIVGSQENLVLVTRNGGADWDTSRVANRKTRDVFLIDSAYGWAVGDDGNIQRTIDGGYTWETIFNRQNLVAVHFISRDTGWVAAEDSPNIYRTSDGGTIWIAAGAWRGVTDIRLLNGKYGWCGISYYPPYTSKLKVTQDGGDHWLTYDHNRWFALSYKTGSPISTDIGCFVGSGDMALRTWGDLSWDLAPMIEETIGVYQAFRPVAWGLDFADGRTGWAVGRQGAILETTNGGMYWRAQIARGWQMDSLLMSVQAFDGLTARATGYLGRSVLTTDGGTTWQGEETGTKEWLLASSFLTPTLGWVAGENGMVLKYGRLPYGVEEGGKTAGVPRVTWLGPNHPNPFTGGTEIKYELASRGKVKLGVYNVLGQTVRELVRREQEAGAYAIRWDGKDGAGKATSSGVYFYRLEAFGQSQTQKMVKVR